MKKIIVTAMIVFCLCSKSINANIVNKAFNKSWSAVSGALSSGVKKVSKLFGLSKSSKTQKIVKKMDKDIAEFNNAIEKNNRKKAQKAFQNFTTHKTEFFNAGGIDSDGNIEQRMQHMDKALLDMEKNIHNPIIKKMNDDFNEFSKATMKNNLQKAQKAFQKFITHKAEFFNAGGIDSDGSIEQRMQHMDDTLLNLDKKIYSQ